MIDQDKNIAEALTKILDRYNLLIKERIEPLFNFINHFNFSYQPKLNQEKENSDINLTPFSKTSIILKQFSSNPKDLLYLKNIKKMIKAPSSEEDKEKHSLSDLPTESKKEAENFNKNDGNLQIILDDKTKIKELRAIFAKDKTTSIAKKVEKWTKGNAISISRKKHSHGGGSGHVDVFLCCNGNKVPIILPKHTSWSPGVKNAIVHATEDLLRI